MRRKPTCAVYDEPPPHEPEFQEQITYSAMECTDTTITFNLVGITRRLHDRSMLQRAGLREEVLYPANLLEGRQRGVDLAPDALSLPLRFDRKLENKDQGLNQSEFITVPALRTRRFNLGAQGRTVLYFVCRTIGIVCDRVTIVVLVVEQSPELGQILMDAS